MAAENRKDTRTFFTKGTVGEWDFILSIYKDALGLKAQTKKKKPEELLKLDSWYQDELPQLIQSRKDKHVTHDELVQTMKWKLSRGKFYPQLTNLVRINTPLAVMTATRKAFKKLPNLKTAMHSLTNLKGVGPAMASAVLAAGAPQYAPFMADECLLSIPNFDSIDYTVQEYVNFSEQIQSKCKRLNEAEKSQRWTPHKVELALWTYYIVSELNPVLLDSMPKNDIEDPETNHQNGNSETQVDEKSTEEHENDENSIASLGANEPDDLSLEKNNQSEDTNDSAPQQKEELDEPECKKAKTE